MKIELPTALDLEPSQEEPPKFEPREPEKRTLRQWWVTVAHKVGYYKKPNVFYGCGCCGEFFDDNHPSSTLLKIENYHYDYAMSCEWGGSQYAWDETHQCQNCGGVYSFDNGSI